ncbi:MAG TPA: TetR-like C-terminal domain-containing protein [Planctomycetota bacterium]|nr:TetR-like C-terminal domain-containing protein [Planctomycetota bacterium]
MDSAERSPEPEQPAAKKGRPRDEAAHQAIIDFTRELATTKKSYKDITIESIAHGAKVAKSTIYRWWKCKADLVREACLVERFETPHTGSLQGDLEQLVRDEAKVQTTATTRPVLAGTWAELVENHVAAEVPLGTVLCPYGLERRKMLTSIFQAATRRGEWTGPIDVESAYEALFGAIFYRCIGRGHSFDEPHVVRLAKHIQAEAKVSKAG